MAGVSVGEAPDNPVAINLTAMVDIIFCLCVFFMCSFKFRETEGKFDSWLPKDKGVGGAPTTELIKEVRIAMFWDAQKLETVRWLGARKIDDDAQLEHFLVEARDDFLKLGKAQSEIPVTVDAEAAVPWKDVIKVVNICKRNQLDKLEFAFGAKGPG
jgi:biopolymer transport protein ExbD